MFCFLIFLCYLNCMNHFNKYNNSTVVLNNEFIFDPWMYGSLIIIVGFRKKGTKKR